jgi:glucose dehydrogenase
MHNGARKVIGVTNRNVIAINPETGNIAWIFNDEEDTENP